MEDVREIEEDGGKDGGGGNGAPEPERIPAPARGRRGRAAVGKLAAGKLAVEIPALRIGVVTFCIEGTSPLITHKFGEKARRQMEDKQSGAGRHKKPPKDAEAEFRSALYEIKKGVYGVPAAAFKAACVTAAKYTEGLTATYVKGAFHVVGDLLPIRGPKPRMRMDAVRVGPFKVADLRYRPCFDPWKVDLSIRYNEAAITPGQIANLISIAGFAVGVGEWRPEKGGSFGQFRVVD